MILGSNMIIKKSRRQGAIGSLHPFFFPSSKFPSIQNPLGGKGNNPKTVTVATVVWHEPVAKGRTTAPRHVVPRTAPQNTVIALVVIDRVPLSRRLFLIKSFIIPVQTPLPDVSVHVV